MTEASFAKMTIYTQTTACWRVKAALYAEKPVTGSRLEVAVFKVVS